MRCHSDAFGRVGFALFYLRGVAPKEVKSSDIYWGAIPWVFLQLILVALVVAFPKQVTMFLDKPIAYDLDKVIIEVPAIGEPQTPGSGSSAPGKSSGDPLQDLLNQQQEESEKAGKAIEDAFKK